jgi:hypothetical protein
MASPLYEVATCAKFTEGHSSKAAKKPIVQGNFEEVVGFISISCRLVVSFSISEDSTC